MGWKMGLLPLAESIDCLSYIVCVIFFGQRTEESMSEKI